MFFDKKTPGRNTYAKKRSNGKMKCGFEEFGDVAPGLGKGCWCDADTGMLPYEAPENTVIEKCGMEGEDCECITTVHYGDGAAKDFAEMSKTYFKSITVAPNDFKRGWIDCGNNLFGDVLPGKKKQCFCERPDKPQNLKPDGHFEKCGSEDDHCQCHGRVFYGREDDDPSLAARKTSE
jgi:hypothetical protein